MLGENRSVTLPDWDYARWCRALEYRELRDGVQWSTKALGEERDRVLAQPAVRALVEWAGSRRRAEPAAAGAAALVAVGEVQHSADAEPIDLGALAQAVQAAVDTARPRWASTGRRPSLLAHPDRLAAPEPDATRPENPLLGVAVSALLRLAVPDVAGALVDRAVAAVSQAADWWSSHAIPPPEAVGWPHLPGVTPAQSLCADERVSAFVSDRALLGLVTGPRPGGCRPCQVAWRRGLTFWTAARLSGDGEAPHPPPEAIRWWRGRLSALHGASGATGKRPPGGHEPAIGRPPVGGSVLRGRRSCREAGPAGGRRVERPSQCSVMSTATGSSRHHRHSGPTGAPPDDERAGIVETGGAGDRAAR